MAENIHTNSYKLGKCKAFLKIMIYKIDSGFKKDVIKEDIKKFLEEI